MSDASETDAEPRGEADPIPPHLVRSVSAAIAAGDRAGLIGLVAPLHAADEADLLELLRPRQRRAFVELMGDALEFETLTELDEALRSDIISDLEPVRVAEAIRDLESDDAVFLLEDLESGQQDAILSHLPPTDRAAVRRGLDYPEETAGRLMQADFVAVPPFWTVGQTIDHMRDSDDLPHDFYEIFVVDPTFHLVGTVPLSRILRTRRPVRLEDIMDREQTMIPADQDQEEVANTFGRYNLVSAAVVDETERLVGVITIDDIVDVIQEERDEDIGRLAGVGDERLTDTVWRTTRRRWVWLSVNMVTALIAALVIAQFDATIEQLVALAVLMPIVAALGGNAGIQTMTVAVRALAVNELVSLNSLRAIAREAAVGILNGALFATLLFAVVLAWFGNALLAGVFSTAIVINMITAALAGILVPLSLDRAGVDPAIASSVFVTTVTDVVGFFAFLGLAAWLLL